MPTPPLKPLPQGRTLDQLRNHYQVEKEIASRLKAASRDERQQIYATMYDELFARVPDHSRLQIRDDPGKVASDNMSKWALAGPFVRPDQVFVEFAPGSCRFGFEVAARAEKVIGIDISDQRGPGADTPGNFELVVYDGYNLELPAAIAHTVFSDQLLEHFHPEDTELHLALALQLLKPGGRYIFRTPHRFTGPHDISAWFSADEPEGFHLKEWTYGEFDSVLRSIGYSSWQPYRLAKGRLIPVPMAVLRFLEKRIGDLPRRRRVPLALRFIKSIVIAARK